MVTTTTGIATEFIQFTRASNATVTDSDGKVKWAPHNLLTNSESFDAAAWGKLNATITANSAVAPNGTTTADLIQSAGGETRVNWAAGAAIANATMTMSVSGKYVNANGRYLWFRDFYSGKDTCFDLFNGVVVTPVPADVVASISPEANGFYRCSATVTEPSTAVSVNQQMFVMSSSSTNVSSGLAGGQFYLWGASIYRSDLGGMQANTSAYPMYNPTTPKNLLGYTEDFSSSPTPWANTRGSIIANSTTGPINGLQTADAFNQIAGSTGWAVLQQTSSVAAGRKVFSVYAKPNGKNYLIMQANLNGAGNALTWFNVSTGAAGTTNAAHTALTPVSLGNGWWRFAIALDTTAATWSFGVGLADADNSTTVTDVGGLYVWGAQLSDSASLDSYSPVYGAAVTSAAYYGPRRDFDGATLACKGLLVEEQRTNLQLNSNVFGTSTFATTVVGGAAASPSGLIDASSLACTSTTGRAILSTSVTSGVVYTFSVFIKAGTNTSAYIELAGTSGSGGQVVFNLSNGTVTSGTGGAIVPAPNGFYRCSVTSTATGTGASDMRIGTGDATSKTVFVYGAQLEANASFATSYIPTGAATATRNADVASVSTQAFPYSATEGTLVANGSFNTGIDMAAYFVQLGGLASGTAYGSSHSIFRGGASAIDVGQRLKGITYDDANSETGSCVTAGNINVSPSKVAYGFAVNNFAASVNGASAITDSSGAMPTTATVMTLGAIRNGGYYLNGHIRQITYLPRRISNTELQTRTA